MKTPLLTLDRWSARYGEAEVLSGVALELGEGEVLALLGRNGAGKSTLLKSIIHLELAATGSMRFLGEDVSALASHELARRGIAYVAQERRIFSGLTVGENLDLGRQSARTWPDGAAAPLWDLPAIYQLFPNLEDLAGRPGHAISGGEQKMLAIARALLGNPLLLLLDEPAEGVAPLILERMAVAVRAVRERGVGIVVAEQNLGFVRQLCDRALVLGEGRIVMNGTFAELTARAHEFESALGLPADHERVRTR